MKLIVGLGNPGEKYEYTRHNTGFIAVDHFFKDISPVTAPDWKNKKEFKADFLETEWQRSKPLRDTVAQTPLLEKIILLKPTTYMNNSGESIAAVANFYKIPTSDIWVLYDDVDFPLGTLKIRQGGGAGGHKGVLSIIDSLGDDTFWRFRIGIGRPTDTKGVEKHVLNAFTEQDESKLHDVIKHTSAALKLGLEKDLQASMNRYNNSK